MRNEVLRAFKKWQEAYDRWNEYDNIENKTLEQKKTQTELYADMGEAWEDYLNLSKIRYNLV